MLAVVSWAASGNAAPPPESEDQGVAPAGTEAAASDEDSSWWDDYTGYWDRKLEWLSHKPLWGNTTQLPAGFLKIKYSISHAQANSYYDRAGNRAKGVEAYTSFLSASAGSRPAMEDRVRARLRAWGVPP